MHPKTAEPPKRHAMTLLKGLISSEEPARRVISDDRALKVVAISFETAGSSAAITSRSNEQHAYVQEGQFRIEFGTHSCNYGPGENFAVPAGAAAECHCLTPGTLINSYTP